MINVNDATNGKSHTPTLSLLGAVLYLAAKERGVLFDGSDFSDLNSHDQEIVADVELALRQQSEDEILIRSTVAEVAKSIAAIRRLSQATTLTGSKYDQRRTQVLAELGTTSAKGASIWPPTSQTAVQRFGSWNEALTAAGLATSKVGRAKGQLRFNKEEYDAAIRTFVEHCQSREVNPTYLEYGAFAAERKGDVPSSAAVRKFYGSWVKALDAVSSAE